MQKIECINLCEIMHKLYQEEPNLEHIIDKVCQEASFNRCERIYFGSSFCGQYFLNIGKKEVEALMTTCKKREIKLTLVLPLFTEKNLEKAKQKIKSYEQYLGELIDEVTVNDFGMLVYMYEEYVIGGKDIKLNIGRLLMKDYRDPRYKEYFNLPLKPRSFTNNLQEMVQKYQINSLEFDPTHATIDVSEKPQGVVIGLHMPYCYETVGQICQMAGIHQPIDKKFRPNEVCRQECEAHPIHYFVDEDIRWMKLGRAVYFENRNCEVIGTDKIRVIYSPLSWEVNK